MRDSVPSASYSSVCNVLRQWNISLIPTKINPVKTTCETHVTLKRTFENSKRTSEAFRRTSETFKRTF